MTVETIAPGASIGWSFDWSQDARVAAGDNIASSTITVLPDGELAASAKVDADTSVSCTLSGAVSGQVYRVTNTVTLDSGQVVPREVVFKCMETPA